MDDDVTARKVAEAAQTTFGTVFSVIDYSLGKFEKHFFLLHKTL